LAGVGHAFCEFCLLAYPDDLIVLYLCLEYSVNACISDEPHFKDLLPFTVAAIYDDFGMFVIFLEVVAIHPNPVLTGNGDETDYIKGGIHLRSTDSVCTTPSGLSVHLCSTSRNPSIDPPTLSMSIWYSLPMMRCSSESLSKNLSLK
jgi:hypothetical protein